MSEAPARKRLTTTDILFRQVHPDFLVDGRPSSQAFLPTKKDEDQLSVFQSSIVSAAESWRLFTELGFRSAAVWAVSVPEVDSLSPLAVYDAPDEKLKGHAEIDFSPCGGSKGQKAFARALAQLARARGVQFQALG